MTGWTGVTGPTGLTGATGAAPTDYFSKPWAAAYILGNGTVQTQLGQQIVTVSHTANSGIYTLNWGNANPAGVYYGVIVTPRAGSVNVTANYAGTTASGVAIYTFSAGTLADVGFTFFTIP